MTTIFVGGSRHISRLPPQVKDRLNNIVQNGHDIVVGDASGADKAVQRHLLDASYEQVTVFCSGESPRNNLGRWHTHCVAPPKTAKGFQFFAAKDREMARAADFGLMIWDGKSAGTVLNVLRLVRAGKASVLINVPETTAVSIKSDAQWQGFLSQCSAEVRAGVQDRATADEWRNSNAADLLSPAFAPPPQQVPANSEWALDSERAAATEVDQAAMINAALASGDSASVVDALGNIARARGMTQVAKEAGLARESLYRSLVSGGNPEFATVLKVMAAVGLRLEASRSRAVTKR